jgi:hypothetical protein
VGSTSLQKKKVTGVVSLAEIYFLRWEPFSLVTRVIDKEIMSLQELREHSDTMRHHESNLLNKLISGFHLAMLCSLQRRNIRGEILFSLIRG